MTKLVLQQRHIPAIRFKKKPSAEWLRARSRTIGTYRRHT